MYKEQYSYLVHLVAKRIFKAGTYILVRAVNYLALFRGIHLPLPLLMTTQEALMDSVDQDHSVQSDL